MQNQFGNYVIQRAYEISNPQMRQELLRKIEHVTNTGRVNPSHKFAAHVYEYLEKTHKICLTKRKDLKSQKSDDLSSQGARSKGTQGEPSKDESKAKQSKRRRRPNKHKQGDKQSDHPQK